MLHNYDEQRERELEERESAEKVCDDAKAMCKRINESLESDEC